MADLALAQTAAITRTDRHTGATDRSNSNLNFVPSPLNFSAGSFWYAATRLNATTTYRTPSHKVIDTNLIG
jgi:hypothetical protein